MCIKKGLVINVLAKISVEINYNNKLVLSYISFCGTKCEIICQAFYPCLHIQIYVKDPLIRECKIAAGRSTLKAVLSRFHKIDTGLKSEVNVCGRFVQK